MTDAEAKGSGAVESLTLTRTDTENKLSANVVETSFAYTGTFLHDPKDCEGAQVCKYALSTYNPSLLAQPRQVTLKAKIRTE